MLDYRFITFLKLCDTMNYRITAEKLNMTQPAVTQHIKFLEREYNCKLFNYTGKKLEKTLKGELLENYSRSAYYNDKYIREKLKEKTSIVIRIGATKTIGEFVINEKLKKLLREKEVDFSLVVNNTEELLYLLEHNKLDFALIEGLFDKNKYNYLLYKKEKFIGICGKNHKFSNKKIRFEELFEENLIVREKGSGTREILEQVLRFNNYSLDFFKRQICINNFRLIKDLVASGEGISFVYKSVAESSNEINTFSIQDNEIQREFNYVFLKNTISEEYITMFEKL